VPDQTAEKVLDAWKMEASGIFEFARKELKTMHDGNLGHCERK